jgi:large subunit ribosomal protein L3
MKFILAKKIRMSQVFDKTGKVIPVTLVQAGPCVVTQVKTPEKDSYTAVQVGFGKKRLLTKPLEGHLKDLENFRYLREFRIEKTEEIKRGDKITADIFKAGDVVAITGVSKGKGFQGVVKRHKFKGGPASHGHRHVLRRPGSIGSRYPQHVRKGVRMAGRMGADKITIKNSPVIAVDVAQNIIAIKGPVPGTKNSLLVIQEAK